MSVASFQNKNKKSAARAQAAAEIAISMTITQARKLGTTIGGTKIAAMLHIEAPRRMMQYLAGQGYVREVSPGDKPKKRMPVWAATAAGLRFVECGPE